jgi:peptide/nickel transport system permease protein
LLSAWSRYASNRLALWGGLVLLAFVAIAASAPLIAPYDPFRIVGKPLHSPDAHFLMGTDNLGRDILSQFLFAARISLMVGLAAALFSTAIGVLVGALSGFFGSTVDELLMRGTDVLIILPSFFLAMFLATIFGADVTSIIVIIGLLSWPGTARLIRSRFITLREKEFVQAARGLGASNFMIIFEEILPNALSPAIVNGSLQVGYAIILESGLSFLGFGDANHPSWGYMLSTAQRYLDIAWWMSVFPGVGILLTVVGANLVGEGMNEALEPKTPEWRRGHVGR